MRKRFVVAVTDVSAEQRNAVTKHLESGDFGWWHWLNDVWLVVTNDPKISAGSLRDTVQELLGEVPAIVVIETAKGSWAIRAPTESHQWFDENWGVSDPQ